MKNNFTTEITLSLILIILLALLLNPFGFWMPNSIIMMIVGGLIVIFIIFASFIWREKVQDEREAFHRMLASRIGYLIGTGALLAVVVVQSFQHRLDPLLLAALGVMILGKIIGTIYSREKY